MMKDWECMTDLLLEDAGPREEPLEDKQVRSYQLLDRIENLILARASFEIH